ncbi:hypothetical protein HK104_009489 [Borealophlyctis nickersoniae]|nr:hypothetical protein HK104_009489 [Borealophlyctis nickersoniae]
MSYKDVQITVENGIGTIIFTREEKFNSFRQGTYGELSAALHHLAERKDTAITVLTGKGKFFSSGADITEKRDADPDPLQAYAAFRSKLELMTATVTRAVIEHPKPLVVLLNGPVIGFPAGIISNSDIIYAAESAYMMCPFSSLGLCAEGASSLGFVQRMGLGAAQEALLFGRKYSAKELEQLGFVNRVFKDADFAAETSRLLLTAVKTCNPTSMVVTKRLIRDQFRDAAERTVAVETDALAKRYASGEPAIAFKNLMERNAKNRASKL